MGENSHVSTLEQDEKQIEEILNHVDELPLDRIERIEDDVEGLDNATTRKDDEQSGRTVTITTEDMQRKKNDVKARTTLLLSLLDKYQLRNDLDTMSLADLCNHLKVYKAEVQKKSNLNSQDMAFISSSKNNSNEDGNTACVTTASTTIPTGSIDEDDMEEIDIKWSMVLLSMRADKFWKRTGKKISIQGSDVAGFDKSKERGKKESYRQGTKAEEKTPKALMAIDEVGWDWPSPTIESTSAEGQIKDSFTSKDVASSNLPKPFVKFVKPKVSQSESKTKEQETPKKPQVKYAKQRRVQRETTRSQKYAYESPSLRSGGYRPHRGSMRPFYRPAGHRPHGPSLNPRRPIMNGARPYKSFFNQAHSYETRPFLKSLAVRTQYRAPWVPTVNRTNPPVSRKLSTGRRNLPTVTRKFPTASRKFTIGSLKNHTVNMGRKGKAIRPSACWT
nr:hypothetical protein [Tanacetum cinerariifolium]